MCNGGQEAKLFDRLQQFTSRQCRLFLQIWKYETFFKQITYTDVNYAERARKYCEKRHLKVCRVEAASPTRTTKHLLGLT